jgi:coproporphyrinogen III oxidase-like Fe-S oxidoreductase
LIEIDLKERLYEALLLGFRLKEGIDVAALNRKFNLDFELEYVKWIEKYSKYELIEKTDVGYRLTNAGMNIANVLLSEL